MNMLRCLTLLLALAGCAAPVSDPPPPYALGDDLVAAGYAIADSLEKNLKTDLSKDQPLIVASFVSVDNLTQSSTFGRMLAEHVASRLSQKGYRIVELRLRQTSVFIKEGKGEFMLSRDVREIGREHDAAAVVVGAYGEVADRTYASARIVGAQDSVVLSSCDYSVSKRRAPSADF